MKKENSTVNRILVTCTKGIVPYLKNELSTLGYPVDSEGPSGVETKGTTRDALLLNLHLRSAQRILLHIKDLKAKDADELYNGMVRIAWEEMIDENEYLTMNSFVDNPTIRDSRFANVKCKDAIVDRIKEKKGRRPDSGPGQYGAVVFIYWKGDHCSVYLDTSGEPLSKRGYRKIPFKAPMQETLAAALVMATGWEGRGNFINPMCGSGTLAIEGALKGLNLAPGLFRNNFGFMHLKGFDPGEWRRLKALAESAVNNRLPGKIIAGDISGKAIEAAKANARNAGVEEFIDFLICDFRDTPVPEGGGIVILNPEYGERMGDVVELESMYGAIGDFFKRKCNRYKGFVFTGNLELAKKIGLRSKRRLIFYNSNIECRLLEYELYEGSRKKD